MYFFANFSTLYYRLWQAFSCICYCDNYYKIFECILFYVMIKFKWNWRNYGSKEFHDNSRIRLMESTWTIRRRIKLWTFLIKNVAILMHYSTTNGTISFNFIRLSKTFKIQNIIKIWGGLMVNQVFAIFTLILLNK